MKRFQITAILALCTLAGVFVSASTVAPAQDPEPKPDKVSAFMRLKLDYAHKVLEGLSTDDYEMIAKNAQKMSLMSLESTWNVVQTPEYVAQSTDFRRSVDRMAKAAREEDLGAATLAYVETTLKCVNCHQYVRNAK